MQQRLKWTLDDLIAYMPEPIKSLQSLPIPVAFVFGNMQGTADVNAEIATRMQQLAENNLLKDPRWIRITPSFESRRAHASQTQP